METIKFGDMEAKMNNESNVLEFQKMAVAVLGSLPLIIIYPFFQKYF